MQKKSTRFFFTAILLFASICFVSAKTSFLQGSANNHAYQVLKVTLDGTSRIAVAVTENGQTAQSVASMMEKLGGSHAINGAFFCPKEKAYARCQGNTTDALRISEGVLYSKRGEDIAKGRTVFGFDVQGNVLPQADNATRSRDQDRNGRDNTALEGMANGIMMPTLVQNGSNVGKNNTEMTTDAKQGKAGNKSFICSTKAKDTVYMGYVDGMSFANFGDYLVQNFECYDAILLDNGNSKNLIYNKKYMVGPGRNLMDAFVVIEKIDEENQKISSQELQEAVVRMYEQGLTKYASVEEYTPDANMTREQAAKFFGKFAQKFFSKSQNQEQNQSPSCSFSDFKTVDPTLIMSVRNACLLGIMKGNNKRFYPKEQVTNYQANLMITRIIAQAGELEMFQSLTPELPMSRGDIARLLYKASKLK